MTPTVNPIEVLLAVDEKNFPWEAFVNLPLIDVGRGGGGGEKTAPPLDMQPMIKIKATKRCGFFSFGFFKHFRVQQ